jgi:hypothetical protein
MSESKIIKSDLTSTPEPSPRDIFEAVMDRTQKENSSYKGPKESDIYPIEAWLGFVQFYADRYTLGMTSFEEAMLDVAAVAFAAIASRARIAAESDTEKL